MSFRNVSRRLRKNRSANLSNCLSDRKGAIDIGITGYKAFLRAEDEDPEYYINEAHCMLADTDKAKTPLSLALLDMGTQKGKRWSGFRRRRHTPSTDK